MRCCNAPAWLINAELRTLTSADELLKHVTDDGWLEALRAEVENNASLGGSDTDVGEPFASFHLLTETQSTGVLKSSDSTAAQ